MGGIVRIHFDDFVKCISRILASTWGVLVVSVSASSTNARPWPAGKDRCRGDSTAFQGFYRPLLPDGLFQRR